MPDKRRLVTSKVCFGSEKAGLLNYSYNKCALETFGLVLSISSLHLEASPLNVSGCIIYFFPFVRFYCIFEASLENALHSENSFGEK